MASGAPFDDQAITHDHRHPTPAGVERKAGHLRGHARVTRLVHAHPTSQRIERRLHGIAARYPATALLHDTSR
jgi:hypothetical protein